MANRINSDIKGFLFYLVECGFKVSKSFSSGYYAEQDEEIYTIDWHNNDSQIGYYIGKMGDRYKTPIDDWGSYRKNK